MAIKLRPVTKANWVQCIRLKLAPDQEGLVAPNVASIAESKFESANELRAIYQDETIVGFLVYAPETETDETDLYWLFRFMIDVAYQKQGIGRAALALAIDEITARGARKINIPYSPKNLVAAKLYMSFGFVSVDIADDGDMIVQKVVG
ncbi:MAG: GNAT family N-acetyltransferase [Chloroflexi bacterium AL-W]|nr:GNAT family N-acetyltransferase [Chloroflexi bacterium AL-N1]NOK66937.1 GNAT family N-acetyltransferase [Chloroflexi bacterium AL-N10]NOK74771.1 GNAT family N-acetyltransferase [Chloroflexi bacterium AL-N5]NOK81539.1 GNAT family N-acetyltransferase [Chloroflexi bacterium AL-W]NOK89009.1 GNAT family N-acetyltransferase [Chloroflexi bacterium AL-N15]